MLANSVPCVATIQLNRYLADLDREDRREAAIESHIEALMDIDGDYDPYEVNNFNEALSELTDRELAVVTELIRNQKHEAAAKLLDSHITVYWRNLAKSKAESLAETCRRCFGLGCPRCEDF